MWPNLHTTSQAVDKVPVEDISAKQVKTALSLSLCWLVIVTPHAQREQGNVIGVGVRIYRRYICAHNFFLNRTLAIDSPFQTFVGKRVNVRNSALEEVHH